MVKKVVNIQMTEELADYYADLAKEMGLSRTAIMIVALKQYKDNQSKVAKMIDNMPEWFSEMGKMAKEKE